MPSPAPVLHFDAFRFEPGNARLLHHGAPIPLSPKAFQVLVFLCERAGRLVTKEELLDEIWGRQFISEGVIKNTIQELRRALGDNAKAPRCIETVHRRGYRFVAKVDVADRPEAAPPGAACVDEPLLVGRDDRLRQLDPWLQRAMAGNVTTVFVSGEAGIGKTALIDAFTRRAATGVALARGQCVERFGQGEPYLPLLEAIGQLARRGGAACVRALRRYAPSWLAQLPWLLEGQERMTLAQETQGGSRDRMLRELGEFLRTWSETQPILLLLEDLHWTDHATLDAIAALGRRKDGTRLMLLGSYRPVEVLLYEHPFKKVRNELLMQGLCQDLPLAPLTRADVEVYLHHRLTAERLTETLVAAVHRRTEGLPLFMVRAADEMAAASDGPAALEQALAALPDGLRHLVMLQLDRLPPSQRAWLDAAAACGRVFSAELLAHAADAPLLDVEAWCERQAQVTHLLRHSNDSNAPYTFIHAYYQELAYALVPPARRRALHQRIGAWLERHRSDMTSANELALHFERGGNGERAVRYLHQAALGAFGRRATLEAGHLLQRALDLLERQPPDAVQHQRLELLTLLPSALIATRGYAVPELPALYQRLLGQAKQLGDTTAQFYALYKMWTFRCSAGPLTAALDLAQKLYEAAQESKVPLQRFAASFALASTYYHLGENAQADPWFDRGRRTAVEIGDGDTLIRFCGEDILAIHLALHALTRQTLGQLDQALALMEAARERAARVQHPYSTAAVIICSTWLHRERGANAQVAAVLPELERIAAVQGYPFIGCIAHILQGWVAATIGDAAATERIRAAIDQLSTTGSRITRPIYHHQLADACLHLGRHAEGLQAVTASLGEMDASGERRYLAEAWLLRGELLASDGREPETARRCFEQARTVARDQGALLLELRAACALAQDGHAAPRQEAQAILERFEGGLESPVVQAARRQLLE